MSGTGEYNYYGDRACPWVKGILNMIGRTYPGNRLYILLRSWVTAQPRIMAVYAKSNSVRPVHDIILKRYLPRTVTTWKTMDTLAEETGRQTTTIQAVTG